MTAITKIVAASELPSEWQREANLHGQQLVKVEIVEVAARRTEAETDRLLAELHALVPTQGSGDVTELIRSERARLDGRSTAN